MLRASLRAAIAVSASWVALGLVRPASAVDGVIEINHASALAGGVTASDSPAYPVTLAGPGSFRLTGALTPPSGQHAIVITGSHVRLDMNGFSIRGTATCTGTPVTSCTAHGGDGIRHAGTADTDVVIRDGAIEGMDRGIALQATGAAIEGVTAIGNQLFGFILTDSSSVERSHARSNGLDGIVVAQEGHVVDCEARWNGGTGISAGSGSIVDRNRSFTNWLNGIDATAPSLVTRNNVRSNNISQAPIFGGIFARSLSIFVVRVSENVMTSNGQGDLRGPAAASSGTNVCTNVAC